MKSISFSNLPELGINPLTGEACAFSMRLLCDLNEDGADLLMDYFGLARLTCSCFPFGEKWNSKVGDKDSVGSIMLPREILPSIVRFALFREGYQYLYGHEGEVAYTAFSDMDVVNNPALALVVEGKATWAGPNARLFRNPRVQGQPIQGTRNVHAFTGRAE